MTRTFPLCFALAVMLALTACSGSTRYVRTGGTGDPGAAAALAAAQEELRNLHASLATANDALGALRGANTAQQRTAARAAVRVAQEGLTQLQEALRTQPPSPAAETALAAVGTALERTAEALASTDGALASGAGQVQLASMHTSLDRAQSAINDAQDKLKLALDADPDAALRALLSQTQATLSTAQLILLPLLREDLASAQRQMREAEAERDRLTLAFGKDLGRDGREASRVAPAPDAAIVLTPRRDGVEWRADTGFEATSTSWGIRTRYTITDYGTAAANRLAIRQTAVPWTATAGMVIPGAAGDPATVEFPGRGQVFRGIGYNHGDFILPRQGSYGPGSDGTAANAIPRFVFPGTPPRTGLRGNMRGHAVSSFQYRQTGGLTMKFGALPPDQKPAGAPEGSEGSLIFGDLEALTATGRYNCGPSGDQACDEPGTRDLTVSFGVPSRDPTGDPAYYWTVDVPDPRLTIAVGATSTAANPATLAAPDGTIGRYEALLSNHAGVNDKGTAATGDDSERYLRYAAYGLFQFIDYQTLLARPGRMQTFHYGFDAFGAHNPLPAATADSIAATFKGRTMAWLVNTLPDGVISGLERMRGNVTLHACIGGSGCQASAFTAPAGAAKPTDANDFTGAVHDLEITLPGGAWGSGSTVAHPAGYYAFLGDVLLNGTIDSAGAFSGRAVPDTAISDSQRSASDGFGSRVAGPDTHGYTIRPQDGGNTGLAMSNYWLHGGVEGVFYGPAAALEAAGTWWLPAVGSVINDDGVLGIVGSFGAVACSDAAANC